jgi:hypothetical protein
MRWSSCWPILALGAAAVQWTTPLAAQDERFELGIRGLILLGKGTPANDMIGEGLVGRFALNEQWRLGVTLDGVTFDYETPNRTLGIPAASVVDGSNTWQRVSVFVERRLDGDRRWDWHWLLGVGSASLDDIDDVAGLRVDGGPFHIATVADDELHAFAGGGLHRSIGKSWLVAASLTLEHHATDYMLADRISGASGTIGSQTVYGIGIGISYRF